MKKAISVPDLCGAIAAICTALASIAIASYFREKTVAEEPIISLVDVICNGGGGQNE